MSWSDRLRALRELVPNVVLRPIREVRTRAEKPGPLRETVIVAVLALSTAAGCVCRDPGRPRHLTRAG